PQALAVSPANSKIAYVAVGTSGVFKTTDGGDNWIPSNGPPGATFALGINSENPSIMFANGSGEVYRSTNSGSSWIKASGGLPAPPNILVDAFGFDPNSAATGYAGDGSYNGVYASFDTGTTWVTISNGLTSQNRSAYVHAIVVDPSNSKTLYAGTLGGVYVTHNAGANWAPLGSGLPA